MKRAYSFLLFTFQTVIVFSQTAEWRRLPIEMLPPDQRPLFYQLFCTSGGSVILSSTHGLVKYPGFRIDFPSVSVMAKENVPMEKVKDPHREDGIKAICRGKGSTFFFLTASNQLYYMDENLLALTGWYNPPFYIPIKRYCKDVITATWEDDEGNLFVGFKGDSMLMIPGFSNQLPTDGDMDSDGNFVSKSILTDAKKIYIEKNVTVYSFSSDKKNPGCILIATSCGLMRFNIKTEKSELLGEKWISDLRISGMIQLENGDIYFGTLKSGVGVYNATHQNYFYYTINGADLSINALCQISENEFFVAVGDSLPAIFNRVSKNYSFFSDSIFYQSKNITTDIGIDGFGNLFVIKGGSLYYTRSFPEGKKYTSINLQAKAYAPYIYELSINDRPYYEVVRNAGMLYNMKEIKLKYNQNQLEITSSLHEFWNQRTTTLDWKMEGLNMDWVELPKAPGPDKFKAKFIPPLQPGKYVFRVRAKTGDDDWRKEEASIIIIIGKPFWATWWFWTLIGFLLFLVSLFFYRRHIISVRKQEREKVVHEKELVELEAKALRAQMNPHFVFNSLNSIKSLINKNENEKAAGYLSTFSKLIRTLFQNSDKREVSLYEEIETCKLYTQIEKMRFGDKVQFNFEIDKNIDLKDFKVPALIIQPFIENAIWHGLIHRESGGKVEISIIEKDGGIQCIIDDNGIGREQSKQSKPNYEVTHQSKGIGLTQSRLELDKLLNEREDTVSIIDKVDNNGRPQGTKVILTFKENSR